MRNSFDSNQLQKYFIYNYECWFCGLNHQDCFHHINGRRGGPEMSSILNAAPLNNHQCHIPIHPQIRGKEYIKLFLNKTYNYLKDQGYKLNDNDKAYIEKFKEYYDHV